jgi:hypothetical protein
MLESSKLHETALAMRRKTAKKRPSKEEGFKEILAAVPPAFHIKEMLPELANGSVVKHSVVGAGTQQRWTCGDWIVRTIMTVEDLLAELKKGMHPLCVLEDHDIVIRANLEQYIRLRNKAKKSRKSAPRYNKPLGCLPIEILPKLIKASPSTNYVITCHRRGQGVSKEDRARYAKFPQVAKVLARLDSPVHKEYLLGLIRQVYV